MKALVFASLLVPAAAFGQLSFEDIDPSAKDVGLVSTLSFSPKEDWERGAAEILARLMAKGSRVYTADQITRDGSITSRLEVSYQNDLIRLRIGVREGYLNTGVTILQSLITEPDFNEEAIEDAKREVLTRRRTLAEMVNDPGYWRTLSVNKREIEWVWAKTCQKANIAYFAAGKFARYDLEKATKQLFSTFPEVPRNRLYPKTERGLLKQTDEEAGGWVLRGAPVKSGTELAIAALSAAALGTGKDTTLFDITRQDAGYSYRQEAFVLATGRAWQPRIIVYRSGPLELERIAKLRLDLVKAVETWNDSTFKRARSILQSSLAGRFPTSPLFAGPDQALRVGTVDAATVMANSHHALGKALTRGQLLKLAENVVLDDIKKFSTAWLTDGSLGVTPGN